ncbi:uncharacterized protein LOC131223998 [Magnolia sinica]|uniref:uncharacterized protein LOC131223998 n=1 Tax=Magnolia sinica TaxID=86752 RepID=UPI00265B23DE|nr:uncharacterized protein LOC131223998 [Magnolia sinica]
METAEPAQTNPSTDKDVKAPNLLERAKEEIKAIMHHEKSHDHETHGKSDDIDVDTPIEKIKGPNIFERAKEEIEALIEVVHPKKESDHESPSKKVEGKKMEGRVARVEEEEAKKVMSKLGSRPPSYALDQLSFISTPPHLLASHVHVTCHPSNLLNPSPKIYSLHPKPPSMETAEPGLTNPSTGFTLSLSLSHLDACGAHFGVCVWHPTHSAGLQSPIQSSDKDVKAPNLLERAKEEIKAIMHHEKSHDHETHGKSDDIDVDTPIEKIKGPNIFERAKEEIEALIEVVHPKKESDHESPSKK